MKCKGFGIYFKIVIRLNNYGFNQVANCPKEWSDAIALQVLEALNYLYSVKLNSV